MTEDHSYFYERAEQELDMAQRSTTPEAVRAHYELANRYLDLVIPGETTLTEPFHRNQD